MLLLDSKYGGKMKEYEGFVLNVPDSDLSSVENIISHRGTILSKIPYENYVKFLVSLPKYLTKDFLDTIKRGDIYYRPIEERKTPDYIV